MSLISIHSKRGLVALLTAAFLAGCSPESWDWNWGRQEKKEPPATKPVARAKPAAARSDAARGDAKRGPTARDDDRDRQVDAQLGQYSERMQATDETGYASNDLNSRIARQQDPNRGNRIRKVVQESRADYPEATTEPPSRTASEAKASTPGAAGRQPVQGSTPTGAPSAASPKSDYGPTGRDVAPTPSETTSRAQPTTPPAAPLSPAADAGQPAAAREGEPPGEPAQQELRPPGEPAREGEPPGEPAKGLDSDDPAKQGRGSERIARPEGRGSTPATTEDTPPRRTTEPPPTPAPQVVDTFKQRLEELVAKIKKEPNNLEGQFNLRMMYLLDGQDDKAVASLPGTDGHVQEVVLAHFKALVAAKSAAGRDPALNANQQLEQIEALRKLIRARADLQVPRVALCTAIESFGRYTPIEPAEFKAGEKNRLLLYIEVDNFQSETTPSGLYRTLLNISVSVLTAGGQEVWTMTDSNIEDLARQQRRDFYLTIGELTIDRQLAPGDYVLKVEVEDVLAGKSNGGAAKFKIVP